MQKKQRLNTMRLWWVEPEISKSFPAGVAYFNSKYGDYKLKIDIHPGVPFFMRPIYTTDTKVFYRVEVLMKEDDKIKRLQVGEGFSSESTGDDIHIKLGPYTKTLILGGQKND